MTAREKARAARLRRVPDDLFAAEARRRGWVSASSITPIPTRVVQALRVKLSGVVRTMVEGGDLFYCVRTASYVEREIGEYLKINEIRRDGAAE